MMPTFIPHVSRTLASLLSGFLLVLAFPDSDVSWLAWVALVPLLLAILGARPRFGFIAGLLFGACFFTGVCRWVFEVSKYNISHHAIVSLILGLPLGLFGWIFAYLAQKRGPATAFVAAPFAWTAVEFVRSNLSFLSLPWGFLAHTQHQTHFIIQIASLTGAYGVSFLVATVNSALSAAAWALACRFKLFHMPLLHASTRRTITAMLVVTIAAVVFVSAFGKFRLSMPLEGPQIRVSLVQGNIEQSKKWDPAYANYIVERYAELSREASKTRPDLIVWPEAATPGFVLSNLSLLKRISSLIRETQTPFLMGSTEYPKFKRSPDRPLHPGNTAIFFSPEAKVLGQYSKIHLVPFAEHVPYANLIPWPRFIVPDNTKSYEALGREIVLFDLKGAKFGSLICWETIFPDLFRRVVKGGASFVVNITNEGWFKSPVIFQQYVAMNAFRAVENGVYLLRCANTGITCIIDPYGRVLNRVRDEKGNDIFLPGVLTGQIIPIEGGTVYTRHGDLLAWICIGCSIGFLLSAFLRKPSVAG